MSQPMHPRWQSIPLCKRIKILEDTTDFVVIEKPANLRSVPGHATPDGNVNTTKIRRTTQEAWTLALQSFSRETGDIPTQFLQRLASTISNKATIPRKEASFRRYLERSQKRIELPIDSQEREELIKTAFDMLVARQRPLMNLPQATDLEESAFGQLQLFWLDDNSQKNLRAVHRLDCQTSGAMVFAKTPDAASFLSHAWRERDQVIKHYLALVQDFPPHSINDQMEGVIEVSMEPSLERLKWQVATTTSGKESITKWKVVETQSESILLDLQPITGRTHQLRVHCAHVGSGILGDSLYGDTPWNSELDLSHPDAPILHLHAWKLSFPDPTSKELREYTSYPSWYDGTTEPSKDHDSSKRKIPDTTPTITTTTATVTVTTTDGSIE